MDIIRYFLIVVEVVCCLMLIGVILLQQSKSQGMGVAFGGGMSETLFGSRAGNILTKITITLAIIFLANTALLGIMFSSRQERSLVESAAAPAPLPSSGPVTGGEMVPPPTQRGTLVTDFDEPAAQTEQVVQDSAGTAVDAAESSVLTVPVEAPATEQAPAEPVSP